MSVDPRAVSGFTAADAYERGRPGYPVRVVDRIVEHFHLSRTSVVLDLAAGTGQLSRVLLPRVGRVVAVEPSAPMRTKIAEVLGDVPALDGTAEAIPLADDSVDAVVVGEAFHWFRTVEAATEIARVLTGRGGLALLWNTPTWTVADTPWLEDLRRILAHHKRAAGGYPAGDGSWQEPLAGTGLFRPLTRARFTHVQNPQPRDFVAQVASWSWIANLDPDQRASVLREVESVLPDGELSIPYRLDFALTRRRTARVDHTPNVR